MARTADRYLKLNQKDIKKEKIFQAGNYLRLSTDSDYTGSDSLENQRRLAEEYVGRFPDLIIKKEYKDDGRTGTNFDRPAFARMIADLKQGVINCVIVKDLSRFGREYIEAGNYIEKVFPFLGVRFISIVDRYDSEDVGCDREMLLISLKNLVHEMYARDISKKLGSTFQMRHENRVFYRTSTISYGYKMDQDNKNYCIDEPAAEIIREIFRQYTKGYSKYAISHWLLENRVLTPKQHTLTGNVYQKDREKLDIWQTSSIERILKNPVYIGTVIRHKTVQSLFEGKKSSVVPKEEQVVIEGNHIPIVSEDVFRKAQEMLLLKKAEFKEYRKNAASMKKDILFEGNIFHRKIFCGDCGTIMSRQNTYQLIHDEKLRLKVFKCSTHLRVPKYCDSRGIGEKELCEMIHETIKKQLSLIKGIQKLMQEDIRFSFEGKLQSVEHEKQRIMSSQSNIEQKYMDTYAAYTAGELPGGDFQNFRQTYLQNIRSFKNQMGELKKREKNIKKCRREVTQIVWEWMQSGRAESFTEGMVESFVERIEVFCNNRVEVILKYQDCFQMLEQWMKGGTADL